MVYYRVEVGDQTLGTGVGLRSKLVEITVAVDYKGSRAQVFVPKGHNTLIHFGIKLPNSYQ